MTEIIKGDIQEVMKGSYIDYAMSVIMQRALPDVRDGLKPVHRRILFSMYGLKMKPNAPYKKSVRVVGETIGKYHPHGDSSAYNALVRLSQEFSMRYPLADGHGNFGSIHGDGAAAMRYTEIRPSAFGEMMFEEIKENTVPMVPNFSNEEMEPTVLPSVIPNLLLNGGSGIAVGMATSAPSHNIVETMNAINLYLDTDGSCSVDELIEQINMPDFPTGGIIYDKEEIIKGYKTGRGSVRMVGVFKRDPNGKFLDIVELPYKTNIPNLLEKLDDLAKDKTAELITKVQDYSDRNGMCIRVFIKPGSSFETVEQFLYAKTKVKGSFSINYTAIVDGEPKEMNLKEIISQFVEHRVSIVRKKAENALEKAELRKLILDGLLKALEDIDRVVEIIKKSSNKGEAREKLMVKYQIVKVQADAILDMRLSRLTSLSLGELTQERKDKIQEIIELKDLLNNRSQVLSVIKKKNNEIVSKFGDERRTAYKEIEIKKFSNKEKEIMQVEEKKVVTLLSPDGYVKTVSPNEIKTQNRNTKGQKSDAILKSYSCKTTDHLLAFSSDGRAHKLLIDKIPQVKKSNRGFTIDSLVGAEIQATCMLSDEGKDVFIFTKNKVKRTKISEFTNMKRDSVAAIKLDEGDEIVNIVFADDSDNLIVSSADHTTRFKASEVRATGRTAKGMKSMNTDEVLFADVEREFVVFGFSCGNGLKLLSNDIPLIKRGGKGVAISKNQEIIGMITVNENSVLVVSGESTVVNINTKDIEVGNRGNKGVIFIKSTIKRLSSIL